MSKIHNAYIKVKTKYNQFVKRQKLKHKDVSIISNNCWAGSAFYQPYGLPYNTPTIGLGFLDADYMKFIQNLEYYLSITPEFVDPQTASGYSVRRKLYGREIDYPVARLDDIFIWFTHYKSQEEAFEKWERRKKRVNLNRILIKWSMRYNCPEDTQNLQRFLNLPYKYKIAFVPSSCTITSPDIVIVPELDTLNIVGGDETEATLRLINLTKMFNSLK